MENYEKKSNLIIKFYFLRSDLFLKKIYHHKFKKRFLR